MENSQIFISIISVLILVFISLMLYFFTNVGIDSEDPEDSEDSEDSEDEYVEIEGNDYGPSEVDLMRRLRIGGLEERDCWGICRICNARGYNDCNKICRNCQKQSS